MRKVLRFLIVWSILSLLVGLGVGRVLSQDRDLDWESGKEDER